jgi:tripartite-type tricarboxylate transporter receptor subunit TctC
VSPLVTRLLARLAAAALTAPLAIAAPASALAQAWPAKPVRLVVAFAPGGPVDIVARIAAHKMEEALGRSIVVENRAGAGGMTGTDLVAKAAPDGYTLMVTSSAAHAAGPNLWPNVPYDAVADFTHLGLIAQAPVGLMVRADAPWRNLAELVAAARARPGTINFGSGGPGSLGHLTGEMVQSVAGFTMLHIPYRGSAPAQADLLAGQIQAISDTIPSHVPQVRAGKLRILAIGSSARLETLPDLATYTEQGYPAVIAVAWFGLTGPAKLPADVVQAATAALAKTIAASDVKAKFAELGLEPQPAMANPPAMTAFVRAEVERWGKVVRERGIKAN